MKKSIIVLALFIAGFSLQANAQRFAYVDSEYILEKMPEYRSAQRQLEQFANEWRKEIETRIAEIDRLYKNYQAELVILPEDVRKRREEEIVMKEKSLNEYRQHKFGPEGDLFKKRQELIKPVQDKVFDAVQRLAREYALDFVFDKAGAVTMLHTNAKFDRSDEVLDILGIKLDK